MTSSAIPIWSPTPERVAATNITAFADWLRERRRLEFDSYDDLWRWSVGDLAGFWSAVWEWSGVEADGSTATVLDRREMPGATWYPDIRLNYAEHLLRGRDPDAPAVHHASELRDLGTWSWGQLQEQVARIRSGLVARGVRRSDRVVAYMPNLPETLAAFIAVASLGATWSCCSPDFGTRSVVDRFRQIEPSVLLAVDGYRYGGRDFDRRETVDAIAAQIPGLEHVVRLGYLADEGWEEDFLGPAAPIEFARVPFDHPLWILFSSGTTGLPKAIVQGHGGILLEQLKTSWLHLDAQKGDRFLWFTTPGWMMWNFLVGVLLTDAEIVLFDGNPGYPDLGSLWDLSAQARVTTFGTSASFIASCMADEIHPARDRDLSDLRAVGATGSPLSPEGFRWIYDELGSDTWLFSTSGGTDVCTAFVGGVPTLPVYEGELQARSLGCDVQAFNPDGESIEGAVGELVLIQPMPSMPLFFWDDSDGERYRESYFDMYPGVWRHGDWIEITRRGTAIIHGRSDSTINRGGIRMGTSEIYRAVLAIDEISDAVVVDVDGWMPLFVVLVEGVTFGPDLVGRIAARVRAECSPRHVPNEVFAVAEVPRTLSGKVLEVPIKRILLGHDADQVLSRGSIANPKALEPFLEMASRLSKRTESDL